MDLKGRLSSVACWCFWYHQIKAVTIGLFRLCKKGKIQRFLLTDVVKYSLAYSSLATVVQ